MLPLPEVHDPYQLIAFLVLIGINLYQMRQNNQIKTKAVTIEKQTNGLIQTTIAAVSIAARAEGINTGRQDEQLRIVAKDLAESKSQTPVPVPDPKVE